MKTRYSKYKFSGVEWIGEIPDHWDRTQVKRLVKIKLTDGPHTTPNFIDSGVPFISVESIKDDKIDFDYLRGYISKEDDIEFSKKSKPKRDDILLVKSGSTTGKVTIVETDIDFNIWSPLCLIRPRKETILPRFLFTSMKSDFFQLSIQQSWSFGTQPNIGMGVIENLFVVVPPIPEQEQIVKYLDEQTGGIDNLILITEQKIELLKENRTSTINRVITKGLDPNIELKDSGVEWIGEIPKHWTLSRIGYVSILLTGFPWKSDLFDFDNGTKILRGENVSEGFLRWGERSRYWKQEVSETSQYWLKHRDVIVSMDGSKVGKNFVQIKETDLPILLHQRMCRIRVGSKVNSDFLTYFIGSTMFRYYIDISKTDPMIPHITEKNVYDFMFSLPPLSEQEMILKYLDQQTQEIDTLISIEQQRIETLKEYRQSLISEVITGKVRVSN